MQRSRSSLALFPPHTICGVSASAGFTPQTSAILPGDTVAFSNLSVGVPTPTYQWDFGDGSPLSTDESPSHTYNVEGTYTVTLTATNLYRRDVATGTVQVGSAPTAGFTPASSSIKPGDTVTFTNTSVGVPTPTYQWDFGDGSPPSASENPGHTYDLPGTYTVVLTATNLHGQYVATGSVEVAPFAVCLPVLMRQRP